VKAQQLKNAASAIRGGEFQRLNSDERSAVVELIETVLDGYDPLRELGIARKNGRPPKNTWKHESIAGDYLARRALEPDVEEVGTATEVAERWGVSQPHVRECVKQNKHRVEQLAKRIGWRGILLIVEGVYRSQGQKTG
jgi:hypothetical protein